MKLSLRFEDRRRALVQEWMIALMRVEVGVSGEEVSMTFSLPGRQFLKPSDEGRRKMP